jgi:branched-subunit amino acid ABC-type transport system permease component
VSNIGTLIVAPLLPGIAIGMLLLLIASGLTLVFGTMRVLNFAHGGFVMFGAFTGYTVAHLWGLGSSIWVFSYFQP